MNSRVLDIPTDENEARETVRTIRKILKVLNIIGSVAFLHTHIYVDVYNMTYGQKALLDIAIGKLNLKHPLTVNNEQDIQAAVPAY